MINIKTLKAYSQVKQFASGTLFSRDGIGTEIYVVFQGEVAILNSQDNKIITVVGPGGYFDESLLFSDRRPSTTTIAITEVFALPISKSNITSFFAAEPMFMFELMKAMHERTEIISNDFEAATGRKWVAAYKPVVNENNSKTEPVVEKKNEEPKNAPDTIKKCEEPKTQSPVIISHNEFSLFPEGHTGKYELALTNDDNVHMCENGYTCPICNNKFKGIRILNSKLALASTDNDMHKHYKGIEPVYYEVITCPNCLYSALSSMFEAPDNVSVGFPEELKALKNTVNFNFGTKPDSATVFAGYYLALLCASKCFTKSQLVQGKLLHRLSWIYHDCKDEQMETDFTKQALAKYSQAYSELYLSAEQDIQICMIIGELNFKLGNIKEARSNYYNAKSNKQVSQVIKRRAEDRLIELKELLDQEKKVK